MTISELAGKPAEKSMLVNIPRLVSSYYSVHPDSYNNEQAVSFGTSGHRGSSFKGSFNEDHILAITQAICSFRREFGIDGPVFIGKDTHALSEPAFITAVEVLAANEVSVMVQKDHGYTPTPVISHAILAYNKGKDAGLADGIVITPSHNPPDDGGIKYNPPKGGPADTNITAWIENKANDLLGSCNRDAKRIDFSRALKSDTTHEYDYVEPYVRDLGNIIDMECIRSAALKLGADSMGGAGFAFWAEIAELYGLDIDIINGYADPTFSFMTVDMDGKIRMDCSSQYAMANLIKIKDKYDIAFGNDPDFDRHGIVTPGTGLLNPNHYLSAAVIYLFKNRKGWKDDKSIGKTIVTSSMIDRIALDLGSRIFEVPVGFKWFSDGLINGSCSFAGEESAGASFLRMDGSVWTTDKDGFIMDLLAAEITARTGRDPGEHYRSLEGLFGAPVYERIDAAANSRQKAVLKSLSPEQVKTSILAGEKILARLTEAPGNGEPIGGLKVITENGWFAARPSGTEDIYKIYAESFKGRVHLELIKEEAKDLIDAAFKSAGV
ncbi:MAG: alpha-D-glucose phosphate-specific phosphoglucomutase [Deltaproteobacteria bacterium]|nr:alpha-D-glucose phosphate-specific phosphoglucomutase [Deltaproteobacteria bacterium]